MTEPQNNQESGSPHDLSAQARQAAIKAAAPLRDSKGKTLTSTPELNHQLDNYVRQNYTYPIAEADVATQERVRQALSPIFDSASHVIPGVNRPEIKVYVMNVRASGMFAVPPQISKDGNHAVAGLIVSPSTLVELQRGPEFFRHVASHEMGHVFFGMDKNLANDIRFQPRSAKLVQELNNTRFGTPQQKENYLNEARADKLGFWLNPDLNTANTILSRMLPEPGPVRHPSPDARKAELALTDSEMSHPQQQPGRKGQQR